MAGALRDYWPKLAVTVVAVLIATVQDPVPAQPPPLQPEKTEPVPGIAVMVIVLPTGKLAEHVGPHRIPAGRLVTLPLPAPVLLTVRATHGRSNAAVTAVAALTVTRNRRRHAAQS
jgi:hypothetical protein